MAGKNVKPDDTAVILKNFAIIFPLFYIAYYAITGILSAPIVDKTSFTDFLFSNINRSLTSRT